MFPPLSPGLPSCPHLVIALIFFSPLKNRLCVNSSFLRKGSTLQASSGSTLQASSGSLLCVALCPGTAPRWAPSFHLCLVAQSCPILCDSVDCSPPGSAVRGVSQARALEWVAISFSRGSSRLRDRTCVSCVGSSFFTPAPQASPLPVCCLVLLRSAAVTPLLLPAWTPLVFRWRPWSCPEYLAVGCDHL